MRGFQKVTVECPKFPDLDEMLSHWRHREGQKPLQIQGLWLVARQFPPICRPIHFEELDDFAAHPDACAHDTCEAAEAQFPLREELVKQFGILFV